MKIDQPANAVPSPTRLTWTQFLFAAIVCTLAVWLCYWCWETIRHIANFYVPVPQSDYWRVPENLKAYQSFHLGALWRQHNEHRIIFPEIVFAIDMLWAHGRMLLPLGFSFTCYTLALGILCSLVAREQSLPFCDRCYAVLAATLVAFWHGSSLALAQPFLLQWTLMQASVVLALLYLYKTSQTERTLHLVGTIIAAVVATYSSANALLVWPLLLLLAFFLHLSKRSMTALSLSAIVFVGLYFVGYHFSGEMNVTAVLRHPLYFIGFTATYLSMPFGKLISPRFGVSIGLLNLGLAAYCAVKARRTQILLAGPAVVLFGFYVFTLLTILITAAGRMEPADREFTAATASRYLTVPLLNWATLVLLAYWTAARNCWKPATAARVTIAFVVLLFVGTYKLRSWEEANSVPFANAQVAALSIDTGLTDPELISRIFPSPEFLEMFMPPLKAQHLAIFGRNHDLWLGRNLIHLGVPSDKIMSGEITKIAPVEEGVEVVGWVNSTDVRDPFPRILLANELGQVVGWGRRPAAGFPPDWLTGKTPEKEAWIAFANLSIPSRSITAYVMNRRDLIPIPGSAIVPLLRGATRSEVGAPIASAEWKFDSTWAHDGLPASRMWGWEPPAGKAYSSWQGHDEHTGQASVEFSAPKNGCMSMGVLHGPSVKGLSAQFIDIDSGKTLGDVPFREHDPLWSIWKINADPSVTHVRFVANDAGHEWGQWLAVSGPFQCD